MQIREIQGKNYTWLDIYAPEEKDIEEIASRFKLSKFLVQDSLEPGHLPKIEFGNEYVFFILRVYTATREVNATRVNELSNKISFFVSEDKLITIHQASFDFLNESDITYDTIHHHQFALFNTIINSFEQPANWHSEDLDKAEEVIFLSNKNEISLKQLYFQKTEIRLGKKLLLLNQSVFSKMQFPEKFQSALNDVKDSIVQYLLEFEEAIDDAYNITQTYLSISSQKSNEVMKVLTVFSVFFLPLSFIAGLYGMNFKKMPELYWDYGYPYGILLMIVVSLIIYFWFKRKRYL